MPLPEGQLGSARPCWTQLRIKSELKTRNHIAGPGTVDGRDHRGSVFEAAEIAQTDGLARTKFETEEILKRARQA